jgi:MarR family 2-MHQ and catechol resistance regulon transcriptional repressor
MQRKSEIGEHQRLVLNTYVKMMRAAETATTRMHKHLSNHNLTISQFGVLEALYHLGPLCQRDIGKKILKTSGNMTMVVDNLEKRGLVKRQKDPNDRRFITVKLTEAGEQLIRDIFPIHAKIAEQVFSVLSTNELETLGQLLKKLGKGETTSEANSKHQLK